MPTGGSNHEQAVLEMSGVIAHHDAGPVARLRSESTVASQATSTLGTAWAPRARALRDAQGGVATGVGVGPHATLHHVLGRGHSGG